MEGNIMNIAALILALAGVGLSLFQPVIPIFGFSFSDLLLSSKSEYFASAAVVLVIAAVAVACGISASMRKARIYCVSGLSICAGLFFLSFFTMSGNAPQRQNLPFDAEDIALSLWLKTVFVWACCYTSAAVCAFLDKVPDSHAPSQQADTAPAFTPDTAPSPSAQARTFEPVLGAETPALIKRGKIFLSDNDFAEAERYFEQALRQDPENSQAYLGKLMAELRVHDLDGLSSIRSPIGEQKLFRRAVEFADDEEKLALEKCLEANTAHIEAMKQKTREELQKQQEAEALEKKYDEATYDKQYGEDNRNTDYLKRAAELFAELGDYKDSRILARDAYRQHDALQQRREKAARLAPKIALAAGILVAAVCILVCGKPDGYLSARMGDTWSQLRVGASYHRMAGGNEHSDVERAKFHDEAVYWYEKAAKDSAAAKFWLAVALTDGKGSAKKDYERAFRLLGEVAQENLARNDYKVSNNSPYYTYYKDENRNYVCDAQLMLAAMYSEGLGVAASNNKRAEEWRDEVPFRYRLERNNGIDAYAIRRYESYLSLPPEFPAATPR